MLSVNVCVVFSLFAPPMMLCSQGIVNIEQSPQQQSCFLHNSEENVFTVYIMQTKRLESLTETRMAYMVHLEAIGSSRNFQNLLP